MKDSDSSIPEWMQKEEIYEPEKDSDGFLAKSILAVMGMLSRMRMSGRADRSKISAPVKLFAVLWLILLIALSRNMFFSYLILAGVLTVLCLLPGKILLRVAASALGAAGLSALLLLPAVFLGSPRTMLTVSCKVFLSVSMLGLLAGTTPWNRITGSLAAFHVPDIFIFTFDITLKYIAILGDVCLAMLEALKLRSVGHNPDKSRSFSGIFGVTFFKSREMAEEMYGAMICRGYDGTYHAKRRQGIVPIQNDQNPGQPQSILRHGSLRIPDLAAALLLILFTIIFIRLERVMQP